MVLGGTQVRPYTSYSHGHTPCAPRTTTTTVPGLVWLYILGALVSFTFCVYVYVPVFVFIVYARLFENRLGLHLGLVGFVYVRFRLRFHCLSSFCLTPGLVGILSWARLGLYLGRVGFVSVFVFVFVSIVCARLSSL